MSCGDRRQRHAGGYGCVGRLSAAVSSRRFRNAGMARMADGAVSWASRAKPKAGEERHGRIGQRPCLAAAGLADASKEPADDQSPETAAAMAGQAHDRPKHGDVAERPELAITNRFTGHRITKEVAGGRIEVGSRRTGGAKRGAPAPITVVHGLVANPGGRHRLTYDTQSSPAYLRRHQPQ